MNLQELMTLVQEKWAVKILLLDNTYLGMVRQWQEQFYSKNYSGVDLVNPDYKLLAEAYGIRSVSVDNIEDYKKALADAVNHDGPFMLHCKVLKEDNVFPMVPPMQSLSDTMYYPKEKKEEKALAK
jgi:acetolactate synthase-1/2/3 large subunit